MAATAVASPRHRVNIFERKDISAAFSAARDPTGKGCGSLYFAHNFAG